MSTPLLFPIDYYCSVGALTFFLAHMQHYAAKKSFSPFRTFAAVHAWIFLSSSPAAVFITEKVFPPTAIAAKHQDSRFAIQFSRYHPCFIFPFAL